MKNKIIHFFFILPIYLILSVNVFAEDFNFKATEIQVFENGNKYKSIKGGSLISDTGLEITSNIFEYNKITNILEANGKVIIYDPKENITLYSEKIFYYKNEEKVITVGETKVDIDKQYDVLTSDLILFRNSNILMSEKKTTMNDEENNFYIFDNFVYTIQTKMVKGDKMKIYNYSSEFKKDIYNFENAFFNLNTKKFIAKDAKIKLDNELYGNKENEPRLKGTSAEGDEFNTVLQNAVFTSCKQYGDNCPPWVITSKEVKHDKIKRTINYKDAWLKIYDVPVVYFPKFFHPDPSVKRQSGFLNPSLETTEALGTSFRMPYFHVLSKSADLTFKPRIYDSEIILLHTEIRKKTKNSYSLIDFGVTDSYRAAPTENKTSRSHLLFKSDVELTLKNENYSSNLNFQYQKVTNDTFFKVFNPFDIEDELKPKSFSHQESFIKFNLDREDFKFDASLKMNESLGGLNSDRYSYSIPNYYLFKELNYLEDFGFLNFTTSGTNTISNTNRVLSSINNNLNYSTYNVFSRLGIQNNIDFNISNLNTLGKKDLKDNKGHYYKSNPQSDFKSVMMLNSSFPLKKVNNKYLSTLQPKMSVMFSPNEMNNDTSLGRSLSIDNIFNLGRSGATTPEEGVSLTLGLDYKISRIRKYLDDFDISRKEEDKKIKEEIEKYLILGMIDKVNQIDNKKNVLNKNRIEEDKKISKSKIDSYFEFKIGGVIRPEVQQNIPKQSTLNQKSSNLVGKTKYRLSENFRLDYNFSVDNDLKTFENNTLDTTFSFEKLVTTFNFIETNGKLGDSNSLGNSTKFKFNDFSSIKFSTRRNRKINLTEYYNLAYEYRNDCLIAGLRYNKKFYSDRDLKPSENMFFTITIIPLTTFDQSNILELSRDLKKSIKDE